MARRCSHCGNNGHNTRTCSNPRSTVSVSCGLKLFGVQLLIASYPMKKSFSMDCLSSSFCPPPSSSPPSSSVSLASIDETPCKVSSDYLSDGLIGRGQERKKGVPWTEEEHRTFLAGLEKLGKGDWRGISRNFVITRTPTQVASHAQKYFLRQNGLDKKKRRSSLFDTVVNCKTEVHVTRDLQKSKGHSPLRDMQLPCSLNTTVHQVHNNTKVDLSSREHVCLPSCLYLLPNCQVPTNSSPNIMSRPSSLTEKSHTDIPLPDLELTISSSWSLDQSNSTQRSVFVGTIVVT